MVNLTPWKRKTKKSGITSLIPSEITGRRSTVLACPRCGSPVSLGAKTCRHCGFEIEAVGSEVRALICPFCGGKISREKKICLHCGRPVEITRDGRVALAVCSFCSASLPRAMAFCQYCGNPNPQVSRGDVINCRLCGGAYDKHFECPFCHGKGKLGYTSPPTKIGAVGNKISSAGQAVGGSLLVGATAAGKGAAYGGEKMGVFGGHLSNLAQPFSRNVCPYCHSPTIEVKAGNSIRHMCTRDSCPYSHPKRCPICQEESLEIDPTNKKIFCTNEHCPTNTGLEEEVEEHIKKLNSHVSEHGIKGERLDKHHSKRVFRTAIIMALGAAPMIFPGGMAGVMFLFGIWSFALEMFFSHRPKDQIAMGWKGMSRSMIICFFAAGFFLMGFPLITLVVILFGYYTLPSGIAEHDKYKQFLGIFRTAFAIALVFLSFIALGGPPQFKISLGLFVFAYLFTIPIKRGGEQLEALTFVVSSTVAMGFGLFALGNINPSVLFGFGIIAAGLWLYTIFKLTEIKGKEKEESEDKKEAAKEDEEEEIEKQKEEDREYADQMESFIERTGGAAATDAATEVGGPAGGIFAEMARREIEEEEKKKKK